MPHRFEIIEPSQSGAKLYFARLKDSAEAQFEIGKAATFKQGSRTTRGIFYLGLNNSIYNPGEFEGEFGFWAHFIFPTSTAESMNAFTCLNTWDRAKFTYGFMQMAAHVPNDYLALFLRKLLALPEAAEYFPLLSLRNDRIHLFDTDSEVFTLLEDNKANIKLRDYLNTTDQAIERQELLCVARLVHWSNNHSDVNRLQVEQAIADYKTKLANYHLIFDLHGRAAKVCQVVCDIRHQGRGTNASIKRALQTNGNDDAAYQNLLKIGQNSFRERVTTVKREIDKMVASGLFLKTYDAGTNEFV
jgi:hypothetical protein